MKKHCLALSLILLAASAAACSDSKGNGTGTGGTGGGVDPNALIPTADGFLDGSNSVGILGAWYSYGDVYKDGGPGDCQAAGFTEDQCSKVVSPVLGAPFTNVDGKMCTEGTSAKTINAPGSNSPAYAAIWGAGIGLDFNNAGADGGTGKLAWDATAAGVTGFSFEIDQLPLGGNIRVEFPATSQNGNDAAYWGGATNNLSPVMVGKNTIKWAMVGGPSYATNPPAFMPSKVTGIQFHVVSNTSSTVSYKFCVSNLVPLKD
jgi:hypothetical protein